MEVVTRFQIDQMTRCFERHGRVSAQKNDRRVPFLIVSFTFGGALTRRNDVLVLEVFPFQNNLYLLVFSGVPSSPSRP